MLPVRRVGWQAPRARFHRFDTINLRPSCHMGARSRPQALYPGASTLISLCPVGLHDARGVTGAPVGASRWAHRSWPTLDGARFAYGPRIRRSIRLAATSERAARAPACPRADPPRKDRAVRNDSACGYPTVSTFARSLTQSLHRPLRFRKVAPRSGLRCSGGACGASAVRSVGRAPGNKGMVT